MEAAAHIRASAVRRLWQTILVAGLAVLALSYIGHLSPGGTRLYETWLYEGVELLAALGCLARAALVRAERPAWFFIGAALVATTFGDILFDFRYGGNPPFPSSADVAYLFFYPLLYVGIVLLLRRRVSTFSATLWLDGLLAATAAAALGASVLVEVVVKSTHGSRLIVLTNIAYPIGDVLLLALLVFVFSVARWRPGRAWTLIAVGLLCNTVGDAIFLYQTAVGQSSIRVAGGYNMLHPERSSPLRPETVRTPDRYRLDIAGPSWLVSGQTRSLNLESGGGGIPRAWC